MPEEGKCFHALVLPFPAQGHVNPLLRFSQLILLHSPNTVITFANTHPFHLRCLASVPPSTNIRFLPIPDGLPPHAPSSLDASMETFLMHLEGVKKQEGLLEDIILASMSTPYPISCIISDFFFPWAQAMANRLHIKGVMFWTANATTMYAQQLLVTHRITFEESGDMVKVVEKDEDEGDPMLSVVHNEIVPEYIASRKGRRLQMMKEMYDGIEDAACIVVPTLYCLEGPILKAMPLSIPVKCCASFSSIMFEAGKESIAEEQSECLRWLDKQNESSVLYISFGSIARLPAEQMEELALGIEASRQPFLWVVRHDNRRDVRTEEVLEALIGRTGERGMIIGWAPQQHVLSHPAVGGFLTHCGWNSTLESIAMGVPMLCWPVFAEQPGNAELIEKVWKVGMRLRNAEKDVVGREEVAKMVVSLLQGVEGKAVKQRACQLAQKVRNEKAQLQEFMEDVSK